ncbi:MAG: hypothetical protein NT001_01055 [Candidatus Woesearchaeota archaeon]|nr:hypothetical protein [Candidatus Woesearchaeota archaeon]
MKTKEINEYLKAKIKDKKGIALVKRLIKKEGQVFLDIEDIKSVIDGSKETEFFSGDEGDFASNIKNPERINGAAIRVECPKDAELKRDLLPAISRITEKMNDDVHIVWGAGIKKSIKKIRFYAVLGY